MIIAIALTVIAIAATTHLIFSLQRGLNGQYRVLQLNDAGLILDTPAGPQLIPEESTKCRMGELYPSCGISGSVFDGDKT